MTCCMRPIDQYVYISDLPKLRDVHYLNILSNHPSGYPIDMTAHHRTGHRSSAMADVITYRLEDKMVYVPLNSSWTVRLHCFCTPF